MRLAWASWVQWVAMVIGLAAAGCRGCSRPAAPPLDASGEAAAPGAAPDAVARDAGALAAPADTRLRVVAEGDPTVSLHPLADGRLVLSSVAMLYEARRDGSLTRLGALDAYAAMIPEADSLVGYGDGAPWLTFVAADSDRGLLARFGVSWFRLGAQKMAPAGTREGVSAAIAWSDRMVGVDGTTDKLVWLEGEGALPPVAGGASSLALDRTGGLVVLARSANTTAYETIHTDKPGAPSLTADVPGSADGNCSLVPAFDHELYLHCTTWAQGKHLARSRYLRLDGAAWTPAFAGVEGSNGRETDSVAADGSLWTASRGSADLTRCTAAGECAAIARDPLWTTAGVPTYQEWSSEVLARDTDVKTWRNISIGISRKEPVGRITQVFARAPDDVWVVADASFGRIVLHTGAAATDPLRLPSAADARALVRNTRPPAPWVGRCDEIFVRLGAQRDAEAIAKRIPELKRIVARAQRKDEPLPISWALVTGRLHEDSVVGVMLWRSDVESTEAALARVADKVIDGFTNDPVSRPPAYCTLPVLDQVLAKL